MYVLPVLNVFPDEHAEDGRRVLVCCGDTFETHWRGALERVLSSMGSGASGSGMDVLASVQAAWMKVSPWSKTGRRRHPTWMHEATATNGHANACTTVYLRTP